MSRDQHHPGIRSGPKMLNGHRVTATTTAPDESGMHVELENGQVFYVAHAHLDKALQPYVAMTPMERRNQRHESAHVPYARLLYTNGRP